MSQREFKLPGGERVRILSPHPYAPPYLPVLAYEIGVLRPQGLATRSIGNILDGVAIGLGFCAANGIDVCERARTAAVFSDGELMRLAAACRFRDDSAEVRVRARGHYLSFFGYVRFLIDRFSCLSEADLMKFTRRVSQFAPPSVRQLDDQAGFSEADRELFWRATIPTSPDCPWGAMAFRNHVLATTGFGLGMRIGESLALKVKDVDLRRRSLYIARRPDDPDEQRRIAVSQKTLPREISLTEDVVDLFNILFDARGRSTAARRHPYIFTNISGAPLSARGARYVYEEIRAAHPTLMNLTHHVLRRDWHDRWYEDTQKNGYDPVRARAEQCRLAGWTPTSRMPEIYARRAIARSANERALDMQNRLSANQL